MFKKVQKKFKKVLLGSHGRVENPSGKYLGKKKN